jgi:microtubule-associated protein-like 6
LAFNTSGDKLAAVGLDDSHTIAVFDTTTKSRSGGVLLYRDHIGTDIITDIRWKNETEFCTFGINHIRVWSITIGGLKYKKGIPCILNYSTIKQEWIY